MRINPETHSHVCLFPTKLTNKYLYYLVFFVIILKVNVHEEFGVKSILIIRTNYANLFKIKRIYLCKVLNIFENVKYLLIYNMRNYVSSLFFKNF